MNTTTTTSEQTYEQTVKMLDNLVGLATNFTDGAMNGIERGGKDAAVTLGT
jgi:hypothetical protein